MATQADESRATRTRRSKGGEGHTKLSAAVELGRRGGKKGGVARAAALSADRRSEIATKAAEARWRKKG